MLLSELLTTLEKTMGASFCFHPIDTDYPWLIKPEYCRHNGLACLHVKQRDRERCLYEDNTMIMEQIKEEKRGFCRTCHGKISEYIQPVRHGGHLIAICFIQIDSSKLQYMKVVGELIEDCYLKEQEEIKKDGSHSRSMAILNWISTNYRIQQIKINDLARDLNLSVSRTGQLIRSELNSTFPHLLQQQRLLRSKHLLETTGLPVNEIREQTGFGDSGYFYRLFKKEEKMTPLQYRKLAFQNYRN